MDMRELSKRIQILEDLEAIKTLHHEYIYSLNNRQWEETTDCFTEDAVAQIWRHPRCNGKVEIHRLFVETMSKINSGKGRDGHFATMPVIKVDGNRARGHWLLYILIADPVTGNAARWMQGRYECEYAKNAGQWKFSRLVWVNPWPRQPETLPKVADLKNLGIEI